MGCTQKRTHVEASDVLKVNAGLFVVRRFLGVVIPSDFEWALLIGENGDVVVSWRWRWTEGLYEGESRSQVLSEVLEEIARVDWASERINAKVLGKGVFQ